MSNVKTRPLYRRKLMSLFLTSIVTMGGFGAFFAFILSIAHKKLRVEVDPREEQVLNALPGANCGACGFASCRALAEAIVKGDAPVNSCVAGGSEVAEKISRLMGVGSVTVQKKLAFVHCGAQSEQRTKKAIYQGVKSCRAASIVMGADTACPYGCIGFGDCEVACPFNAIKMVGGLPQIDLNKCTGCGNCVNVCPRSIISLESFDDINYKVACSSLDKGKKARQVCQKACIACGLCEKFCPFDACEVKNNLAHIDPRNCQKCGICAAVCPTNAIVQINLLFEVKVGSALDI